jgi:2-polyprenyl-3-methyl-5-hydroxy-6-metoxy-1,4-benzoquinol methylase
MKTKFAGKGSSEDIKKIYLESLGENYGEFPLGQNTSKILVESPRNLLFTLSRYKFVSKMFHGYKKVLEVGCQEGFGAHLISPVVNELDCIDFYKPYIESSNRRCSMKNTTFTAHDILDGPFGSDYEGIFSLDVLEHIQKKSESIFMKNICDSLSETGSAIIGMPSFESQEYASEPSKIGHVNCKRASELKALLQEHFKNVFLFSMNDEVLHTGFHPMSHYLLVLCCSPKKYDK